LLSREEIEGGLRDVFAKMSPEELERELNGAWRELVEEELASRREASPLEASPLEASQLEESRLESRIEESRIEESRTPEIPAATSLAFIDSSPPAALPLKANWGSRIVGFLYAVFKKKPR
jgi:hypothetical protein